MKKCYFLQEISEAINFYSLPFPRYLNTEWAEILPPYAAEIAHCSSDAVFCLFLWSLFLFVLSTPKQRQYCRPSSFTCCVTSPVALLTLRLRGTPLWKKVVLCIDDPLCVHSPFMAVLILCHRLITSVLKAAWKITRFPHALYFVSVLSLKNHMVL